MRTVQEIQFGLAGQTIYYDCPEGRPSSVTSATAYYWNQADLDTTLNSQNVIGAASIEANPDTTIDAASGAGQSDPRILNVAATTGFAVDRSYLVTAADGFREWFDVDEINSGNSVTARHPLHNTYAAADTVQSTRISVTVDSTWVSTVNYLIDNGPNPGFRVRFVYVVNGASYSVDVPFKLVRYAGKHGVVASDIDSIYPGWIDRLPTDHIEDQGRRLIDEAFRSVKLDMHASGLDEAMVAEAEVLDELTRWKAVELGELAILMQSGGDSTRYATARGAYQARFDSLIRITTKVPVRNTTGGGTAKSPLSLSRR
jgi:hypothetical protein